MRDVPPMPRATMLREEARARLRRRRFSFVIFAAIAYYHCFDTTY